MGLEPSLQLSINGRSGRKRSVRSEGELTLLAQSNCQAKRDAMRLRDTEGSALRADHSHVARTKEVMLCVHSILLPSTVQPSASTGCSPCSTRSAAWTAR